jgi:hypothetical protein
MSHNLMTKTRLEKYILNHFLKILSLTLLALLSMNVHSQSLCNINEKTLFSAYTGKVKSDNFARSGKIVSLCSDSIKEPISNLTYKFGTKDRVEMELSAPKDGLFKYSVERNSPRGVDYMISINKGNTTYQIESCQGMTCNQYGTVLVVIQSNKKIAELIADNADQQDILFGSILNETKSPISKVFKK